MLQGKPSNGGRVGLALSGGGFRASLYHVGVLARLADEDRLRDVDVISAVSGGSITAALYALHLGKLLGHKPHNDITKEDYQAVVWAVGHDLRQAVRKNLRMRLFSNPWCTLKMLRSDYSRSDRMAGLYQKHLYSVFGKKVQVSDLLVTPKDFVPPDGKTFDPDEHNHLLKARVPVTLINATTLNTGHNWRFEAIRMGEPDEHKPPMDKIQKRVDKNLRLANGAYKDMPRHSKKADYQTYELSYAVAASTAVPGVFAPLSLSRLYPGIRVQLVDGGVHDNQGVQGLLDRECQSFWISDASGLLDDQFHPKNNLLDVLQRSNKIMGDRMREDQLFGLLEKDHGQENNVAFVHLLQGVAPLHAQHIPAKGPRPDPPVPAKTTEQVALARIRTDLDAFHDVEAYALAQNGYEAIGKELQDNRPHTPPAAWPFLKVREVPDKKRLRLLQVGAGKVGKVFRTRSRYALAAGLAASTTLALFLAAGWQLWQGFDVGPVTWKTSFAAVGVVATYIVALLVVHSKVSTRGRLPWLRGLVHSPIVLLGVLVLWPVTNAYLLFLNHWYLRAGAVPGGDWPKDPSNATAPAPAGSNLATSS